MPGPTSRRDTIGNGDSPLVAEPFLRWAGGKRWLAPRLAPLIRRRLKGVYIEPFLGSGAVFFAVAPQRAILSDINAELVNAFRCVAGDPLALGAGIRELQVDPSTYYRVRSETPIDELARAIRFLYLNRTCYGGLHRTNRAGVFNVPFGGGSRTPERLWKHRLLIAASELLAQVGVRIQVRDFTHSMAEAGQGDVVYCDPVYSCRSRWRFDRYGASQFLWADQVRLAVLARAAAERGAVVVVSDALDPAILNLYQGAVCIRLRRRKSIGNPAKRDEAHEECLFVLGDGGNGGDWETSLRGLLL